MIRAALLVLVPPESAFSAVLLPRCRCRPGTGLVFDLCLCSPWDKSHCTEALAPRLASLRSEVAEEVARRSATMERRLAAAEEVYAARLAKLQRANAEELEAAERKAVAWQASCTAAVEMTVQRLGDDLSQQLERAENDLSELRTENQGSRAKAEDACAVLSTRLEQLETTLSATSAEVEDALRRAPERRQLLEERIDVQQREAEREGPSRFLYCPPRQVCKLHIGGGGGGGALQKILWHFKPKNFGGNSPPALKWG
eukprot:SAG11_NODE_638_length_8025_cov_14.591093_1_plen_256_part_10